MGKYEEKMKSHPEKEKLYSPANKRLYLSVFLCVDIKGHGAEKWGLVSQGVAEAVLDPTHWETLSFVVHTVIFHSRNIVKYVTSAILTESQFKLQTVSFSLSFTYNLN